MSDSTSERVKYERVWKNPDYRRFSPGLKAIAKFDLLSLFNRLNVRSILDVGCGSGKAMQEMKNSIYKFTVDGFDIAHNCLDEHIARTCRLYTGCVWTLHDLPTGYDLLFCTDVMEHIPPDKVRDTLECLCYATARYVFLGIALFPDSFGPKLIGEPLHLSVHDSDWWLKEIKDSGLLVRYHSVDCDPVGPVKNERWFYCLCEKP